MSNFEASRRNGPDGRETLIVRGDLDLATAHHVVTRTKEWIGEDVSGPGHEEPIRFDLSGITFLDSTGLGAMIEARSLALAAGRTVELVAASPAVERVLSLAGLTDLFPESSGGTE